MKMERILIAFSELGATWVFWVLLALSVAGLAIAVERAVFLYVSRDDVGRLQEELRTLLGQGQLRRARRLLEASPSFEARVAAVGLAADGLGAAEERMAGEAQLVRLKMERRLAFLGTLGNNAPFVGLLGTVIGIIGAFRQLEGGVGQVSAGLMAQIGEALVATAIGLLVALPAVAFYNAFQRVIQSRLGHADALGHEILAYYKRVGAAEPACEPAE